MKTERCFLLVLFCAVINTFEAVLTRSLTEFNRSEPIFNQSVALNATDEPAVLFAGKGFILATLHGAKFLLQVFF